MSDAMLSIRQLAAESGESVAVWRKRVQRREITFVKCGRNVRVRREDFAKYIAARVVTADPRNGCSATQ